MRRVDYSNTSKIRSNKGQGIIEGTCMMMVLIPLGVILAILVLNVGFLVLNQQKVNMVAFETAKVVSGQRYYLGCEVPSFATRRPQIEARAQSVANALLHQLGLPGGHVTFQYQDIAGTNSAFVACNLTVNGIKIAGIPSVFPSLVNLVGQGVAAQDPGAGTGPYGEFCISRFALRTYDGQHRWIMYLPAYNAQKEQAGGGGSWFGGTHVPQSVPKSRRTFITSTFCDRMDWEGTNGFRQELFLDGNFAGGGGF